MDEFTERKAWKNKIYVYKRGMKKLIYLLVLILAACVSNQKSGDPDKLVFDHTYTAIEDTKEFFSLKERGFQLMEKMVRHPGPVECRFIQFNPEGYPFKQYLEWCHTNDYKKLKDQFEKSGKGEQTRNALAFRTNGNVDSVFKSLYEDFKDFEILTFHKNYNWEENSKDKLPGWDYIVTKKAILPDVGLFGVLYGPRKQKSKKKESSHSNTANKIIAVLLDIDQNELGRVAKFSSGRLDSGKVSNSYGFHVLRLQSHMDLAKKLTPKTGIYKAVVLRVSDLEVYKKKASPDYEFQYRGQTFYGIKTKTHAWDILATDSDEFVN